MFIKGQIPRCLPLQLENAGLPIRCLRKGGSYLALCLVSLLIVPLGAEKGAPSFTAPTHPVSKMPSCSRKW